jgi:hypothetical protein
MKRFVVRRVAPVALAGALVTGGLFVTSTPANAGVIDDCKAAFQAFLGYFRAVDTAAHHEQAPDNRISRNDVTATVNGNADIAHLPAGQRNLNTYRVLQMAGATILYGLPEYNPRVGVAPAVRPWFDRLDVAGRHDRPDGLVSDIDLRAAIANPGAICG